MYGFRLAGSRCLNLLTVIKFLDGQDEFECSKPNPNLSVGKIEFAMSGLMLPDVNTLNHIRHSYCRNGKFDFSDI
jgi:hypothetical protein